MLIVISPAKTLDFATPSPLSTFTQPRLLDESQQLNAVLRDYNPEQLSALMAISPKLGELNWQYNLNWVPPFTAANAKQAVLAFRGDVYKGLDADSFSADDFIQAQQHLRILSGLYGLLRPLDLMQPYRLEMGTALANPRGKNLYAFWGERIAALLNADLETHRQRVLINLASEEYFRAVCQKTLAAEVITPHFKERKGNGYKIVSFYAKRARGLMSAYILKSRSDDVEVLKTFAVDGYRYNAALSGERDWVFTRETSPA